MDKNVYFIYRSHYDGPLGKRVIHLRGSSILEYFQIVWEEVKLTDNPREWVKQEFEGNVYGLASIFEAIKKYALNKPQTWRELNAVLERYLYIEGEIRQDENTLRVKTDDDELDLAYFFFNREYAQEHLDRVAYLLHESWQLPQAYNNESYAPPIEIEPIQPVWSGEGETYISLLTFYDSESFDIKPWIIKGVRLPTICNYLREATPHAEEQIYDNYTRIETWPVELRLLRAMIDEQDYTIEAALRRCNLYPVIDLEWHMHSNLGLGTYQEARKEFEVEAKNLRVIGDPNKSLISVSNHIVQLCLHAGEYQQWFFYDDRWAAANPKLASSLLRYTTHWDPFV